MYTRVNKASSLHVYPGKQMASSKEEKVGGLRGDGE